MPRLRDVYGLDPDSVPFDFYEVVAATGTAGVFLQFAPCTMTILTWVA